LGVDQAAHRLGDGAWIDPVEQDPSRSIPDDFERTATTRSYHRSTGGLRLRHRDSELLRRRTYDSDTRSIELAQTLVIYVPGEGHIRRSTPAQLVAPGTAPRNDELLTEPAEGLDHNVDTLVRNESRNREQVAAAPGRRSKEVGSDRRVDRLGRPSE
jgi:hypothetical protein